MKITCANFQTSVALNTATRDQILIAVVADCRLAEKQSSIDLPEVAILWLIVHLGQSYSQVVHKQGSINTFRDFYGEYEVSLQSVEGDSVAIKIETGDESFSGSIDLRDFYDDINSIIRQAEEVIPELSDCSAFKSVLAEMNPRANQ